MVVKITLSCIDEEQLLEKIIHQHFFDARVYWQWLLKETDGADTKEFGIKFFSLFFKANINQEWFDCLNLLWNDVQQQWPEPEDSLNIIIQALEGSELDPGRKDTILASLLNFSNDREIIRACYRITPENSESEYIALQKMRQLFKSHFINPVTKETKKASYLHSISALIDDFPPNNSISFKNNELKDPSLLFKDFYQSIQDKYTYFSLFFECYSVLNECKKHEESKTQNFYKINEILSRNNIHTKNPFDGLQFLKGLHDTLSQERKKHSHIQDTIHQIEVELTDLVERYQTLDSSTEISNPDPQKRPFGYIDKPIERFLTYCENIACEIVHQCVLLSLSKSRGTLIIQNQNLPFWIFEEFHTWWEQTNQHLPKILLPGSTHQSPYLSLNNRFDQIQIVIPEQTFEMRPGLDHVDLVLCNDAAIITENELPLYHENKDVISREVRLNLPSPSSFYTIDLADDVKNLHWKVNAFDDTTPFLVFDMNSLKSIEKGIVPSKQFLLLTKKNIAISPESAILETGQLFGGWKDFSYFIINPEGEKRLIIGGSTGESLLNFQHFKISLDSELFDKNIFLNDQKVIIGKSPILSISYYDPETLFRTILSIHPGEHSSLKKPIYCDFEENREILDIHEGENICEVDLGAANLLGDNPIGYFTIRIRNEFCRFDTRFECVCLPDLRIQYSKKLFLPQKNTKNHVKIQIQSRDLIRFEPDSPVTVEKTNNGVVILSALQQRIGGTLSYPYNNYNVFTASLSILIPQLAWRFENESKGAVWPIQRSVLEISETEYESFGENPIISVFLPESFKGQGILSMEPQKQYVIKNITNGRGLFPLDRFNDTLRVSDAETTQFLFSMDLPHGESICSTLFEIKRWIVRLNAPIEVVSNNEGDRTLEISWTESFTVCERFLIIWKLGRAESNVSKVYEAKVNEKDRHIKIDFKKGQFSSGIYYLHFIRKSDQWDSTPVVFPGEKALNIFQFPFKLAGEEILHEADEYFEKGKYLDAIHCYRELESQNKELVGLWKQKVMNRLIYPRNIPGSLACITEIIEKDSDIKETDLAFFAFLLKNNILDRPHLLNKLLCQWIVYIVNSLLMTEFSIPKKIICSHLEDIERAFLSVENIADHERGELMPMLDSIKEQCVAKEPKKPHREVKLQKRKRTHR